MSKALTLVREILLSDTDLGALIGDRIYLLQPPQNATRPHIVLHQVSGVRSHTLDLDGPRQWRISIDCRSDSVASGPSSAQNVGDVVDAKLEGFKGVVSGVDIDRILSASEVFTYEDGSKTARRILDYYVHPAG